VTRLIGVESKRECGDEDDAEVADLGGGDYDGAINVERQGLG